jgi:hypothetical protein
LAEAIYHDDRDRYLGIVRSALFELPSEVEETALHWRASRLEGTATRRDEALSIYAPPEKTPIPIIEPPAEGEVAAPRVASCLGLESAHCSRRRCHAPKLASARCSGLAGPGEPRARRRRRRRRLGRNPLPA